MDALGLDVEETKGENLRGSGYWEAPRKRPDETGTAAAAAPAEGSRNYGAELDELRREVAALRREGHKGVSVASTEDWSDCPTTCPERTASDPLCPAWQQQILVGPLYKDACPRLPARVSIFTTREARWIALLKCCKKSLSC